MVFKLLLSDRFGPDITTQPPTIITDGFYSSDQVKSLHDALVRAEIHQPVTFPIRAGIAASTESQTNLIWLLKQVLSHNYMFHSDYFLLIVLLTGSWQYSDNLECCLWYSGCSRINEAHPKRWQRACLYWCSCRTKLSNQTLWPRLGYVDKHEANYVLHPSLYFHALLTLEVNCIHRWLWCVYHNL